MGNILTESLIIVLLLLANGVFAMTEIAVVSARRTRLRRMAERGDAGAKSALELSASPNRFLSTVQIGITLVGVLAGAFGGATIAEEIGAALQQFPRLAPYGEGIGIGVVVLAISFLSLVLGELVPKRIGLSNPEGIARVMARPMHGLAKLAAPVVKLLSFATDCVLRLLGTSAAQRPQVSEDEVRGLMQEGLETGVFVKAESQMVESVLALDRLPVREIMTPRAKVIWINRADSHDALWHKIVVSRHSHFPVYEDNRDNVVGMLSVKSVYANLAAGVPVNVADLMEKPQIVPASQTVIQLLDTFKQSGKHIALVADEFGAVCGLVTLIDVMEAIAGDFPSQDERNKPAAKNREDGSWLIDGMVEIERIESLLPGFKSGDEQGRDYQTLAGFIVKHLGRVPKEGETFETQGYVFEILDMDRYRVDKVFVMPVKAPSAGDTAAQI